MLLKEIFTINTLILTEGNHHCSGCNYIFSNGVSFEFNELHEIYGQIVPVRMNHNVILCKHCLKRLEIELSKI